jgi:peroxiredoxin
VTIQLGQTAPSLQVSEWVQGGPITLGDLKNKIVVVEVFQVNCPGCFIYGLPEAIEIHNRYSAQGVVVLGLATAFEDYDKNTTENLKLLLSKRETIGETLHALRSQGQLVNGNKLAYSIPFPVAYDLIFSEIHPLDVERVMKFIRANVEDFDMYHPKDKDQITKRVREYLESRPYIAATFEEYGLKGTPSTIYIDKKGNLRETNFGSQGMMKYKIEKLLQESG